MTGAAASTSFVVSSNCGLFGFSRKPIVAALGRSSCNRASPLAPSSPTNALWPVRLPPGRLRLATRPSCTGVDADAEHNWDAGARSLGRENRKHSGCDDHSHLKLDQ